jgi:hypothetical protein
VDGKVVAGVVPCRGIPFKDIRIDPKKGGRWYEINAEGAELYLGSIGRVGAAEEGCVVVPSHRHLERHGEGRRKMSEQVGSDGGWPAILE